MKCTRCSAELPVQSQFCLRCGTPIQRAPSATAPIMPQAGSPFAPPKSNNKPMLAIVGVLVLAILALGGVVVKGLMTKKAEANNAGQLVQAPGAANTGGLVQAPGDGNPNQLVQAPADSKPGNVVQKPNEATPFPSDIDDYLKFLKRIEARKQELIRKQTGDALLLLTQAKGLSATIEESDYNNTFSNINKNMNYNAGEWETLTRELETRTPPEACRDLHNKYYDQLGKVQGVIIAVNDALAKVQTNPTDALHNLTEMQGKTSQQVDASIQSADDALAAVCDRYKLKKDFDIKGDAGSASMFR